MRQRKSERTHASKAEHIAPRQTVAKPRVTAFDIPHGFFVASGGPVWGGSFSAAPTSPVNFSLVASTARPVTSQPDRLFWLFWGDKKGLFLHARQKSRPAVRDHGRTVSVTPSRVLVRDLSSSPSRPRTFLGSTGKKSPCPAGGAQKSRRARIEGTSASPEFFRDRQKKSVLVWVN